MTLEEMCDVAKGLNTQLVRFEDVAREARSMEEDLRGQLEEALEEVRSAKEGLEHRQCAERSSSVISNLSSLRALQSILREFENRLKVSSVASLGDEGRQL